MKVSYLLRLRNYLLIVLTITMLSSCEKTKIFLGILPSPPPSATGWEINKDGKGGIKSNIKYKKLQKGPGPGLVLIDGGTFTMGRVQDDVMHDWNNSPKKLHVRSFYMDETEVTNESYREYLYWLKMVFPPSEDQYKYILSSALPDTLVWRNRLGANEALVNNYLRHPAYKYYPVVGVSWLQATKYADWRTDRVNEGILMDRSVIKDDIYKLKNDGVDLPVVYGEAHFTTERYLKDPNNVFGESKDVYDNLLPDESRDSRSKGGDDAPKGRHVRREDGILLPKYRLPTEAEWEFAALALKENQGYENTNTIEGRKKFPWNGNTAKFSDSRKQKEVKLKANFKNGRGDYKGIAGWSTDMAGITNKVMSYPPNAYGLYDMAGNVSEWVADVYRPIIDDDANDFNYYRGNVFQRDSVDADGRIVTITDEEILYDTLSNGKLIPRNLPGEISKVNVSYEDTYMRPNYNTADNTNYGDGDKESSIAFNSNNSDDTKDSKMYNSPDYKYKRDENGKPKYDTNKRTSLIDDKVRVYKGGSWADRIYWLDPAQRRFMRQDMSSNSIGFRCAMDRVGKHK